MSTLFRIDDNFTILFPLLTNDIEYNIKLLDMYYHLYEYDSMDYSMFFHKVFPTISNKEIKVINLFFMRECFLDDHKTLRISVYNRNIYDDHGEIALYESYKIVNDIDPTIFKLLTNSAKIKLLTNSANFVVF